VLFVTRLALEYRMTFNKDVVIDMICYRRLGHNEADEPAATQPMMYQKIRARKTTAILYAEKLIGEGVIAEADFHEMQTQVPRRPGRRPASVAPDATARQGTAFRSTGRRSSQRGLEPSDSIPRCRWRRFATSPSSC
jgi:2-oxoglutarate dehydrogenase complex dehydrogenase (E1) component-like enzyme